VIIRGTKTFGEKGEITIKYSDSYEWIETFDADNTTATQYSTPWFEVDFANELFSDVSMVMSTISGSATFDADVEKYSKYAANSVVISHTQVTADGTTLEESTVSAVGAGTGKIGTRVRYVFTLGGTWTGTVSLVFKGIIVAKRN